MESLEDANLGPNFGPNFGKSHAKPLPALNQIPLKPHRNPIFSDPDLSAKIESHSLESLVDFKIRRFLEQLRNFDPPKNLHSMVMDEVERILIKRILDHTGGKQVQAAEILGLSRNTLRKRMVDLKIRP